MRTLPLVFSAVVLGASALLRRRVTPELVALGLVFAAVLAVYGSGVVQLPDLERAIREVGPALGAWTYVLVGALAFLETAAFIGLLVPGEVTIVVGGFVAGQGVIELVPLVLLVWACAVSGDTTSYFLGRKLGRGFALRYGARFGITQPRLELVERFFARHGGKTILIGRFVGPVRSIAPFLAGASRMPLRRFVALDVLGAGLWSTTFCVLGYVFWQSFDEAIELVKQGKLALGVLIGLVVAGVVAYRFVRSRSGRRPAPEAEG